MAAVGLDGLDIPRERMLVMTFVIFVVLGLAVWGFVVEPRWLRIRRVAIRAKRPLARPITVLHLSDTHFPLYDSVLRRFFHRLSSLEPDLVVITGDIIENNDGIRPCAEAVAKLKPRYGIYAVLGNHDHYEYGLKEAVGFLWGGRFFPHKRNDVAALKQELSRVGCRVLVNERVELALDGSRVSLIGLDDPVTRQADVDKAFKNANDADVNLLLTHTLDVLPQLDGRSVDLALSGHTHGGQFSIPFFGALPFKSHSRMGRKYMAGLSRYGETVTYTSRGLGMGKFAPFRLFCRPESILYSIQ